VILNGCETYSSGWAGAFGVPFSANGTTDFVADYQFVGRTPRAFVGWTAEAIIPSGGDITGFKHAQYGEALGYLFYDWMSGFPLYLCLEDFADVATGDGFTDQDKWKISGCVDLTRGD
jgi:hypothetical protein